MKSECNDILDIGSRRELFVDYYLIDELNNLSLVMAEPKDEGIVFEFDQPWEGRYSGYGTVMKLNGNDYRLYYSGCPSFESDQKLEKRVCVALSEDGIHWQRPELGFFEAYGTLKNNIIFDDPQLSLNFAPFVDTNPNVSDSERFKAVGGTRFTGMVMFCSSDGFRWEEMFYGQPVMHGDYLDSKNVVFWSPADKCYVMYARIWQGGWEGYRWIGRAVSDDLKNWTELEPVKIIHDGQDAPMEHYYHNNTMPYFRADHINVSVCGMLVQERILSERQIAKLDLEASDSGRDRVDARGCGGLMVSRGGNRFDRIFMEDFIRPAMGIENWLARCNFPYVGVVQTGPAEMSIYVNTRAGLKVPATRRYSLRLDGFSSLRGKFDGGDMVTKPFIFSGEALLLNYSTAARGFIKIQFETPAGEPIPGFTMEDCDKIVGNEINGVVSFKSSENISKLAGKPVRLRIQMKDSDLYSLRFANLS